MRNKSSSYVIETSVGLLGLIVGIALSVLAEDYKRLWAVFIACTLLICWSIVSSIAKKRGLDTTLDSLIIIGAIVLMTIGSMFSYAIVFSCMAAVVITGFHMFLQGEKFDLTIEAGLIGIGCVVCVVICLIAGESEYHLIDCLWGFGGLLTTGASAQKMIDYKVKTSEDAEFSKQVAFFEEEYETSEVTNVLFERIQKEVSRDSIKPRSFELFNDRMIITRIRNGKESASIIMYSDIGLPRVAFANIYRIRACANVILQSMDKAYTLAPNQSNVSAKIMLSVF